MVRRPVLVGVTGVSLYIVFPTLVDVIGSAPQLRSIRPGWFAAMALLQVASTACLASCRGSRSGYTPGFRW
jgi:hypothetical protein